MNKFRVGAREPLFFLHIPKTAGMSMRAYLQEQYYAQDTYPAQSWAEAIPIREDPKRFSLVQGHFNYNMRQALRPETKVVTILRDPLLRTVSALRHLQRDADFHRDHALTRGLTLQQIVRNPALLARQANVQASSLCASTPPDRVFDYLRRTLPTEPGAEAVNLEQEPTLELALKRLGEIEFLGMTNQLGPLLRDLAGAMQYHPAIDLPLINNAPDRGSSLDEFDAEDIARLQDCNAIDLALYDHGKDIIVQRQFVAAMLRLLEFGTYARPRGVFGIEMQDPVPGSGWYRPETSGQGHWRWTGPKPDFTIELPLQLGVGYRMEMRYSSPRPLGSSITLRVNMRNIGLDIQENGSAKTVHATLPKDLLADNSFCARMVFNAGEPVRVGDQSGGDLRLLGIAVNHVAFMPIG